MLLEELRLFDNQVYGVAHGLLMGQRENVWMQALSLFDEVKQMDSSTASAFYNALTDMLWHFGQVWRSAGRYLKLHGWKILELRLFLLFIGSCTTVKSGCFTGT